MTTITITAEVDGIAGIPNDTIHREIDYVLNDLAGQNDVTLVGLSVEIGDGKEPGDDKDAEIIEFDKSVGGMAEEMTVSYGDLNLRRDALHFAMSTPGVKGVKATKKAAKKYLRFMFGDD